MQTIPSYDQFSRRGTATRMNRASKLRQVAVWSVAGLLACLACSRLPLIAQERAAGISGVLQDSYGVLITGGDSVTLEAAGGGIRHTTQTDYRGGFRFSGVPAGTYTLSIYVPGFDRIKIKLNLLAGEDKSLPPFRLNIGSTGGCLFNDDPVWTHFLVTDPPNGALAGSVNAGPHLVENARVTLACWLGGDCRERPERTSTDAQGNFEFKDIPAGRYYLSIQQKGFYTRDVLISLAGGLESFYSFSLTQCPDGGCPVGLPPPGKAKATVCE